MKKRVLSLVLTGCMVALAATGCGSSNSGAKDETASKTAGDSKKLTIMMSNSDSGNNAVETVMKMAADKMGIEIDYDVYPDDQMMSVLNTKLATGNASDVIMHNIGIATLPADKLAVLDGDWKDHISEQSYPMTVDSNDNVLKAPFSSASAFGLLYNKEVLKNAGVELPINNFAEFKAACDKIQASGVTPVYMSNKENWTAQIWLLATIQPTLFDDPQFAIDMSQNKAKPSDNEKLVKLMSNLEELRNDGYLNQDYMSATNTMAEKALMEGQAAFYAGFSKLNDYSRDEYEQKLGMMWIPIWDDESDQVVTVGQAGNFLSVPADNPNADLAKEFVNTLLSKDVLQKYYELLPGISPYKDLGFDLEQGSLGDELLSYATDNNLYSDYQSTLVDGKAVLNGFYGNFSDRIQGLIAGKSVQDTLDDWYNAYAEEAKARNAEGF
jgi:raffinose/stachyose/melibiose transport system substrate-binding protein